MNRHLFVGDLHTKYHILEKVIELGEKYDKVIFLGDYVDDWGAIPEASYNLLNRLIEYKKENPDKVVLLLGNHDLSEWFSRPFACSGFNPKTHSLVEPLFRNNAKLFDIAYAINGCLCSHAGFTKEWVKKYLPAYLDTKEQHPEKLAYIINYCFHNRDNYNQPDYEFTSNVFFGLAEAGYMRGGGGVPSPTWADSEELVSDWLPYTQIVGHTPHYSVTFYNRCDREIYFCDTFSTVSDGTPIGDSSLLAMNNGLPEKIDLEGKIIPYKF